MRGRHQPLAMKQDIFYISMNELISMVVGGRIRLREISQPHVKSIKDYILTNLENKHVLLPPLVGHQEPGSFRCDGDISIIDGSHRLKAYVQLKQLALRTIHRKEEEDNRQETFRILEIFETTHLPIQLFEGLTIEEQHQLYLDLNFMGNQVPGGTRKSKEGNGHSKTLGQQSGQTKPKGLMTSWVYQL
jgi:DNA sulfur modification protein DndB